MYVRSFHAAKWLARLAFRILLLSKCLGLVSLCLFVRLLVLILIAGLWAVV
jgi:hypothetical protein